MECEKDGLEIEIKLKARREEEKGEKREKEEKEEEGRKKRRGRRKKKKRKKNHLPEGPEEWFSLSHKDLKKD